MSRWSFRSKGAGRWQSRREKDLGFEFQRLDIGGNGNGSAMSNRTIIAAGVGGRLGSGAKELIGRLARKQAIERARNERIAGSERVDGLNRIGRDGPVRGGVCQHRAMPASRYQHPF